MNDKCECIYRKYCSKGRRELQVEARKQGLYKLVKDCVWYKAITKNINKDKECE